MLFGRKTRQENWKTGKKRGEHKDKRRDEENGMRKYNP